jgi:formylglycine-generating enzyme required for sulfatase activity
MEGQKAFYKKDYATAIKNRNSAKTCTDAASECTNLDALIEKAKNGQQKQQDAAAERRRQAEADRRAREVEQQRLAREKAASDKAAADKLAPVKSSPGSIAPGSGAIFNLQPASLPAAIQKLENDMVPVTGGTFTMDWESASRDGSGDSDEKPAHQVSVRNFSIGRYEVTQAQWRAVMGDDLPELYNKGCNQCPVEGVSWNDIQDFLKKLNSLTGKRYRLPTEAEWEYAARGGNQSRGYLYSGGNNIETVAWYNGNAQSGNTNGEQKTTRPVGGKSANELGLYDMSGNVWEWCEDDWHDNYQGAPTDGRAWVDSPRGSYRVFRGGSWYDGAVFCRAASRYDWHRTYRNYDVGFRLALQ